jgi:hypothetical protein
MASIFGEFLIVKCSGAGGECLTCPSLLVPTIVIEHNCTRHNGKRERKDKMEGKQNGKIEEEEEEDVGKGS